MLTGFTADFINNKSLRPGFEEIAVKQTVGEKVDETDQCTFGKSVQRDVDSIEKLFLLTVWTKVTQNFSIAH